MKKEESDALLELERVVRILVYQQVDKNELEFFRKVLRGGLEKINEFRELEAKRKQVLKAQRLTKKEIMGGKRKL